MLLLSSFYTVNIKIRWSIAQQHKLKKVLCRLKLQFPGLEFEFLLLLVFFGSSNFCKSGAFITMRVFSTFIRLLFIEDLFPNKKFIKRSISRYNRLYYERNISA